MFGRVWCGFWLIGGFYFVVWPRMEGHWPCKPRVLLVSLILADVSSTHPEMREFPSDSLMWPGLLLASLSAHVGLFIHVLANVPHQVLGWLWRMEANMAGRGRYSLEGMRKGQPIANPRGALGPKLDYRRIQTHMAVWRSWGFAVYRGSYPILVLRFFDRRASRQERIQRQRQRVGASGEDILRSWFLATDLKWAFVKKKQVIDSWNQRSGNQFLGVSSLFSLF